MDPRNRNEEKCNLPREEINASKELIRLQRERIITIKPCDKGAGILILNFKDYMHSCYQHLLSKQNEHTLYYKRVEDIELQQFQKKSLTL